MASPWVVRGNPTEEELAALVVVLTRLTRSAEAPGESPAPSGWSAYWRNLQVPAPPGPHAWRLSGWA